MRERLIFLKNSDHPLADDEKVYFGIPHREVKQRLREGKKKRRIVITCEEQNYLEFTAWNEAYMLACGENPTLRTLAIIEAMKAFNVKGWLEEQNDAAHVMGKNLENCE